MSHLLPLGATATQIRKNGDEIIRGFRSRSHVRNVFVDGPWPGGVRLPLMIVGQSACQSG